MQSESRAAPVAGLIEEPTAIVHDWFQGYHGSERVVDTIRTGLFAEGNRPDIYTFHAARELLPTDLARSIVHECRLSRLPGIRQQGHRPGRWRYLLPYMPHYFERLPLDRYDLVISSSHAYAKGVRVSRGTLHVCYCHTPIRYLWLPDTEAGRVRGLRGIALRGLRRRLAVADLEAARRPHAFVANSTAVRERIQRLYGRDATVIHPPVDVADFDASSPKESDHFLWVHRLIGYKQPELVAEAFRGLPYRLTMVGVGPLERRLRSNLPPNVELLSWLPRDQLVKLYERASGFIHVGEEDFGMSMVEALAAGTPVLALGRGGALDIVRPGVDGILIDRPELPMLRPALRQLAESGFEPSALAGRAQLFSRERFLERFAQTIASLREHFER